MTDTEQGDVEKVALRPETYEQAVQRIGRVAGFAPGGYVSICGGCGRHFNGDKRAIHCLPCAVASLKDLPPPSARAELVDHLAATLDLSRARVEKGLDVLEARGLIEPTGDVDDSSNDLEQRLSGRAAYLKTKGSVKDSGLLEQAANALAALKASPPEGVEAVRVAFANLQAAVLDSKGTRADADRRRTLGELRVALNAMLAASPVKASAPLQGDQLAKLREAMEALEELLSAEIKARFGTDSSKTEAEVAGKSRVYPLLNVPRNIARNALKALSATGEPE